MADAQFKAAAARLRATLASKYTPTEATVNAGAVGGSKVYIGGQLYDGTVDGVQAVKNTGRLAAAQYAPATGGSATVRSVSAVDEGGLAYLPLNGSAAMTGDLDMGSNDLINVILVDGRDVSADGANLDALLAAPLLTVGTNATLTNERALTFSDAFGVTDGRAGNTYMVALSTPGTLSATSANAAAGAHTHAVTASSNPGITASLLKSAADGSLTLTTLTATTKVATPTLENASGTLLLDPSTRVVTVDGSLVARYSAASTVGAVVQNVQNQNASYTRAVFGYNAIWDDANNWWNLGTVGANDAAAFLVRNSSSAIDVVFHPSSGNVTRTMDHTTFTAGTKFTLTGTGKLGVLNNGPTYQVDVTGDIRATQTVYADTKVQTPLITTASNVDLVIDPTGAVKFPNAQTVRTSTFDSGLPLIQGWQFNEVSAGSSYSVLSIGKLRANELLVDIFVANETRVDRGDQLWTKSYGILYSDFTTPSAIGGTTTLTVEDSPAITGAVFTNNDWVLLRKLDVTTGLSLFQVWGQVATYVNNANGSQSWTFTLRSGPTSKLIPRGSLAIDFGATGQAFLHLSVIDPAGAPYLKLRKWAGSDPYTAANYTTYVQLGHLGSVGNSYYTPTGHGLYIRSTAGADRFLVADDNGLQLRGASLALYKGTNQTVNLSYTGQDVWIGTANTDKRLIWDGALLTVKGTILVTGGDAAKVDFSNLTATLDNLGDGSTFKRTNANEKTGAARAYTALNSSNVLVTSVVPATAVGTPGVAGLYLGADYMGYHTGNGAASGWKTYLDNAGNFRFLGNAANNYIQWAAASNKLQGVGGGTEQWYADATDGKIKAGGGNVELSALGIDLQQDGYLVVDRSRALSWWPAIGTKTGTPSQEIIGYYDANSRSVLSLTATNATFGSRILLTAGDIAVTGTMSLSGALSALGGIAATGTVTATTGMSVGGTAVSLAGHTHSYLPLGGGTLTGTVTTQALQPGATNTHNLGTSGAYYNNAYINNLYTNVIVGTPSYAHSHAASDITSGVLDFVRIPTTWTGALTLDVDAAGAYNYVRFKTDAANSKVWDLIGYAWDHATTAVRNDLALTYTVGSTTTTLFLADGATGVLDFGQTPTVAGTAVSLATHNHDSSYVAQGTYTTHLSSDSHTGYLLATGARAGATSQAQTFTNGVNAPALSKFGYQSSLSLDTPSSVLQAQQLLSAPVGSGQGQRIVKAIGQETNPSVAFNGTEYISASTFRYDYDMAADYTNSGTNGVIEVILQTNGAGAKSSTFALLDLYYRNQAGGTVNRVSHLRVSDASSTGPVTYLTGIKMAQITKGTNNTLLQLGSSGDVTGNYALYSASAYDSYLAGSLGIKKTPSASYALDVSGAVAADSVSTPALVTASGNLSIAPAGGTTTVTGSLNLTNATGTNLVVSNTATTQYSSAALILRNSEVSDAGTQWYIFAEKSAAGAATGASTFQIRKRNASGTEAVTPFVVDAGNNITLNNGYSAGAQTYGNVGIKRSPAVGYVLDVNGTVRASGVLYAGSNLEMTGTVLAANGDNTAPAVAALADTNTGIYFPSADNLAITTGGVQRLLIDNTGALTLSSRASVVVGNNTLDLNPLPDATGTSEVRFFRLTNTTGSKGLRILTGDNTTTTAHYIGVTATTIFNAALADLDFNVRGDTDANLLLVDASTDRIGVGTGTPGAKLHVYSSADESLRLESSSVTGSPYLSFMQGGTRRGFIQQHDSNDTLILASEYGNVNIKAAATAGTDSDTAYLVIKAGGYVGVNTADPQYPLDVTGDIYVSSGMMSNAWSISTSGGATFSDSVYTPGVYANGSDLTVSSVSGNTVVNAAGNVDLRLNNVSQWLINTARLLPRSTGTLDIGDYNRRVRTLHAAELYVETLVAQGVLATIGGRILVAPTTRLIADVTLAATTIDVAHNNLVNGAYIYLNASPTGLAQLEAMQVTSTATAISGGYRYTVTRNLDGSGANAWNVGDAVVSLGNALGQGYIDLSSTSTIHNHYGPAQTMYVRTSTATWNGVKPVTTTGNLRSFVDYSADEFGFATGNDLTLTPGTGFRGVTVDRTNGVRLFNTDLKMYSGTTLQAAFDYADGLNMLADSSASSRRQQINWWANMADRSGTPMSEIYTYVNAGTGPNLIVQTRATSGVNGVVLELRANGNRGAASSITMIEPPTGTRKLILSTADDFFVHAAGYDNRIWAGSGGVGINQATASYALDVNGSCHATSFPTSSDARLKTAIWPVTQVLDRLDQIGAYRFQWAPIYHGYDQYLDKHGRPMAQIGFMAQEIEAQFPELVSHWQHTGRNGEVLEDALAVDYSRMVPLLLMAIRELRAEVATLRKGRM